MKVTLSQSQIQRAFVEKVNDLSQNFDEAIIAPIWDWTSAPSPRDIVDTGALLRSKQVEMSSGVATIKWTVPYAGYVKDGTSKSPARDWIEYGVNKWRST